MLLRVPPEGKIHKFQLANRPPQPKNRMIEDWDFMRAQLDRQHSQLAVVLQGITKGVTNIVIDLKSGAIREIDRIEDASRDYLWSDDMGMVLWNATITPGDGGFSVNQTSGNPFDIGAYIINIIYPTDLDLRSSNGDLVTFEVYSTSFRFNSSDRFVVLYATKTRFVLNRKSQVLYVSQETEVPEAIKFLPSGLALVVYTDKVMTMDFTQLRDTGPCKFTSPSEPGWRTSKPIPREAS